MKKQFVVSLLLGAALMAGLSNLSWAQTNQSLLPSHGKFVHVGNNPDNTIPNVCIHGSPALVGFSGKVYLAYRGCESNNIYYTSTADGKNWAPKQMIPSHIAQTTEPVGLAAFKDRLYVAHKGEDKNNQIFYTSTANPSDSASWATEQTVPDVGVPNVMSGMSGVPALVATAPCVLEVYFRSASDYIIIKNSTSDGTNWGKNHFAYGSTHYSPALGLLPDRHVVLVITEPSGSAAYVDWSENAFCPGGR
jgi:hypothetical protein